jgi:hypothetical protein
MMSKRKQVVYKDFSSMLMGCPICKFEYNHIIGFEKLNGGDGYKSGVEGIRGDVLVLYCECENGHEYKIMFGEHKGMVYLFAEAGTR